MIRSLYSGVSGMKNHQLRMDVIGNNIANVNTTGFKASRVNFQDTLYQTIKSGSISTNPAQIGLGNSVSSINNYMQPSALQGTGRTLDLGINGSGFFKVTGNNRDYYTRDGIFFLTNDGKMVNSNGYQLVGTTWEKAKSVATITSPDDAVVTGGTLQVKGLLADGTVGQSVDITLEDDDSLDDVITKINAHQSTSGVMAYKRPNPTAANPDQCDLIITTVYDGYDKTYETQDALEVTINLPLSLSGAFNHETNITNYTENVPLQVTNVPVSTINIYENGMITGEDNEGAPLLFENGGDVANINLYMFPNQDGLKRVNQNLFQESASSGTAEAGVPGDPGYGTIASGYLEMSNVELTDEFTNMITTQRGYQANARIITVSDTMLEELLNLKR